MERRKVKNGEKSPWDNVLPDQFQTVAAVLASDWCQKTCVFWHQSEAKTAATVWNWSGKTFRPFRLSLVPTICPWVSEDGAACDLTPETDVLD